MGFDSVRFFIFSIAIATVSISTMASDVSEINGRIWKKSQSSTCHIGGEIFNIGLYDSIVGVPEQLIVQPLKKIEVSQPKDIWDIIGFRFAKDIKRFIVKAGWGHGSDGRYTLTKYRHNKGSTTWEFDIITGVDRNFVNTVILTKKDENTLILQDKNLNDSSATPRICTFTDEHVLPDTLIHYMNTLPFNTDEETYDFLILSEAALSWFGLDAAMGLFKSRLSEKFEKGLATGAQLELYLRFVLDFDIYKDYTNSGREAIHKILIPFIQRLTKQQKDDFMAVYIQMSLLDKTGWQLPKYLLQNHMDSLFFELFPLGKLSTVSDFAFILLRTKRFDLFQEAAKNYLNDPFYFGRYQTLIESTIWYGEPEILDFAISFKPEVVYTQHYCYAIKNDLEYKRLDYGKTRVLLKYHVEMNGRHNCLPLIEAIRLNKPSLAELFLKNGADPNNGVDGKRTYYSPLFRSFLLKNLVIGQMLVESGADRKTAYDFKGQLGQNSSSLTICDLIPLAVNNSPYSPNYYEILPTLSKSEADDFRRVYCPAP